MTRAPDTVCIVGMHRSGTSVLTRILNLSGVHLGSHEVERGADNPTGYWEHPRLRELNDELLARLGGSWSQPPPLVAGWEAAADLSDLRDRARELLATDDTGGATRGWKDPRTSLTLPFWTPLVPALKFVVCVRNPLAVADSLVHRDGLPREIALDLWLEYTVAALRNTQASPRVVVHYEDLLDDWMTTDARIKETLGMQNLKAAAQIRAEVERFIDPRLCHHEYGLADVLVSEELDLHTKSIYLALTRPSTAGAEAELSALVATAAREREGASPKALASHAEPERSSPLSAEWTTGSLLAAGADPEPAAALAARLQDESRRGALFEARLRQRLLETRERARAEISALVKSLGEARNQRDATGAREAAARERLEQLEASTHGLAAHRAELEQDKLTLSGSLAAAVERDANKAERLEGLGRDAARLRAERDAARDELARLQGELGAAREELASRAAEAAARLEELAGERDELARERQELSTARDTARRSQREEVDLHEELVDARGDLDNTGGELVDTRAELAAVCGDLSTARGELARAEREQDAHAERLDAARAGLEAARVAAAELRASLDHRQGEQRLVAGQLDDERAAAALVREQLEPLRRERDMLANTMAAMHRRAQLLEARNSSLLASSQQVGWLFLQACFSALPLGSWVRNVLGDSFFWFVRKLNPESIHAGEYAEARRVRERRKPTALVEPRVPTSAGPRPYDVLVFSVIDWHFRHQRPQHLALQFAARGHRVVYVSTTFSTDAGAYRPRLQSVAENVWTVSLPCGKTAPVIYRDAPTSEQLASLSHGMRVLREELGLGATLSVVNHPFWQPLAGLLPGNLVLYDCMDRHGEFSNTGAPLLALEARLLDSADLLVCSARLLVEDVRRAGREPLLLPNGAEFEHFAPELEPEERALPPGQPVIGYFGAIADWFDMELLAAVARSMPDCRFVLVGSTFSAELEFLEGLENVLLVGEVAYDELPTYLHSFDVCVIPFKLNELTRATNPVKVYEYLSAGKPVVATRLPELEPLGDLVRLADTAEAFARRLREALGEADPAQVAARRAFAQQNTWDRRGEALTAAVGELFPAVSVVVLTYNGLEFTKACLNSLDASTSYPTWELVVVDNASRDGTQDYLREYAGTRPWVRLVLNEANLGFAAGNNKGAAAAAGEYLVFLNNDTYVTDRWLPDLLAHFRAEPSLALLNPVTNNIGNEARVDIQYADMAEMAENARRYTRAHRGQRLELRVAAFFCVAVPRRIWDEIGELDEGFGVGFFEDDDYAMRVRRAGYRIACAEDVFIHHHLSASFGAVDKQRRDELFARNKKYYESKWGPWIPHEYRADGLVEAGRLRSS